MRKELGIMANTKEIKKKIEGEVWKKAVEKATKEIQKKISIKGFRKGTIYTTSRQILYQARYKRNKTNERNGV